ncbi:hypothetical protein QOZ80_8AG0632360 [Eleusine coracana subsp. coracana]|nr:hypothetical protein QOZ80_8AG0632360 [Eleusine coracana subsp. coracana]
MDDVKPGVPGEGRKAAAAGGGGGGDGAPRRPLVPSEKGNAAASPAGCGRRREHAASRFKPAAAAAATRRTTSPSPARAASALDGAPSCNNRARSADRARVTSSPAPSPPQLKPSSSPTASSRPASPARDAAAEPRGTSAKQTANGLRSESPVKKIDRLVRGLPSEPAKASKPQTADAAPPERKRSPVRRNGAGDQQRENARPPESSPADKRVVEQHRWPAMATGRRGSAAPTPATTSTAPAAGNAGRSSSASSAGRSPMARPPEGAASGKCLRTPSNEMAKRPAMRRSRREGQDSDASSQTTSEGSRSACRSASVPVLHRSSSSSRSKVVVSAAASPTPNATCQSPSRIRPSPSCRSKCASSSPAAQPVFNYIVDARKGKKSANQVENAHQLRLLHNRYLQWRFVNAISEATLSFRRNNAESLIFGVSEKVLALQDGLTTARIDVRLRQQEMKLYHIVTEQVTYLEQWPELEEENSSTLAEAVEALKASTLRLPVTSGAHAEAIAVKNAVSSAVDVMQALSSSICYLQPKVEDRTSLVSQLSVMARQEKSALDECRELLATAAKLQVQESSLRTHLIQLREDS